MGTGVGERLPWVTLHTWPSASKSRLPLVGNIDIQTDEIQATAVVVLFSARVSIAEGTHRSQEDFFHAQFRFTRVSDRPAGDSKAAMPPRRLPVDHHTTVLF